MDKDTKDFHAEQPGFEDIVPQDTALDTPDQTDFVAPTSSEPAATDPVLEFGTTPEAFTTEDFGDSPEDLTEETGDEETPPAESTTEDKDEDKSEADEPQQSENGQKQKEQTQQRMQAPPITKVKKEMPEWLIGIRDMLKMLFVTPVVLVQNLLVRLTGGKEAVKALREETADQIKADKVRQANKAEGDFLQDEINNLLKFRAQDPEYTTDGLTITSVEVFQPKMGKDDILYAIHVKCANGSEYGAAEYALYMDQNRQLRTSSVVPREVALQLDELIRAVDLQYPDLSVGDVIEEDEIPDGYDQPNEPEQDSPHNTPEYSRVHNDCDGIDVDVVRSHLSAFVNIVITKDDKSTVYHAKAEYINGAIQIDGLPAEADKAVVAQTVYQAYAPHLNNTQISYAQKGIPQKELNDCAMETMIAYVHHSIKNTLAEREQKNTPDGHNKEVNSTEQAPTEGSEPKAETEKIVNKTEVSMYILPGIDGQPALVVSEHKLPDKTGEPQDTNKKNKKPVDIYLNGRQLETTNATNFNFMQKNGTDINVSTHFSQGMHPNTISAKLGGWFYRASNAEGVHVFRMNKYEALCTMAPEGRIVSALVDTQHDGTKICTQNPITNGELKAIAEVVSPKNVDWSTAFSDNTYTKAAELLAKSASEAARNKSHRNYFVMGDSAFRYDGKELEMCKLGVDATYKVQMTNIDAQKLQEAHINGLAALSMESSREEQPYIDEHDELPPDEPVELD
jgi:hypothetical protein